LRPRELLELAILVSAPIVLAALDLGSIDFNLTVSTSPYARNRTTARLRNLFATFLAMGEAFAARNPTPGSFDLALDSSVDLVLDSSICRPTARHPLLLANKGSPRR
jgi:hypothetical protein